MKSRVFAPVIIVLAGLTAVLLRHIAYNDYFRAEIELFDPNIFSNMLAVLSAMVVVFAVSFYILGPKNIWDGVTPISSSGNFLLMIAAVILIVCGGIYTVLSVSELKTLEAVMGLTTVVSGFAVMGLSKVIPGKVSEKSQIFLVLPIFWSCYWLLVEYRSVSATPEIQLFIFRIFSVICAILLFYQTAACFIKRKPFNRLFAVSFVSVYFMMVTLLADYPHFFRSYVSSGNFAMLLTYAALAGMLFFAAGIIVFYVTLKERPQTGDEAHSEEDDDAREEENEEDEDE